MNLTFQFQKPLYLKVVKMVLNTQFFNIYGRQCDFIPKKKETLNNQYRCFYYVILAPELRNDQKLPKNGSLNRDFLNFLYRYGIFWMPLGESSHPGGSEYVWQRGVEGISGQVTGSRSLPYFQKMYLPQFSNLSLQI